MPLRLVLAACLLALPLATPLRAQEVVQPVPRQDNHERFYNTILNSSDQELILDNLVRDVSRQMLASNADYIELERTMPGLGAGLIEALRPVIRQYRNRAMAQYAPQMIDVARQMFTAEEAGQLADFYGSPLGRRLMQVISGNVSTTQRVGPATQGKEITANAIAQDDRATLANSMADMSPEDLQAITRFVQRTPAAARLGEFSTRTLPIRLAMENELPNAEEMALLEQVVTSYITERLGVAPKSIGIDT